MALENGALCISGGLHPTKLGLPRGYPGVTARDKPAESKSGTATFFHTHASWRFSILMFSIRCCHLVRNHLIAWLHAFFALPQARLFLDAHM